MNKKIIGVNYLHRHPKTEQMLNVNAEHVIIDRKDWEEVVDVFKRNRDLINLIGKPLITPSDNDK